MQNFAPLEKGKMAPFGWAAIALRHSTMVAARD